MDSIKAWNKVASEYDKHFTSTVDKAEDEIVKDFLKRWLKKGTVLDLGCGTAHILTLIPFSPKEYVGIDGSENMLKIAVHNNPPKTLSWKNQKQQNTRNKHMVKITTEDNTITIRPETNDKPIRIKLIGTGKGETDQGLMAWIQLEMTDQEWYETLVISAWNDKKICGSHYEIASCSNKGAGGITRPISIWMNQENPTKHVEMLRITPEAVYIRNPKDLETEEPL